VKMRLRYIEPALQKKTAIKCECGTLHKPLDFLEHALGCASRRGPTVATRHALLNSKLASFSQSIGVSCSIEPRFALGIVNTVNIARDLHNANPRTKNKPKMQTDDHPDHLWHLGGSHAFTDTFVQNIAAPSNADLEKSAAATAAHKNSMYKEAATASGAEFYALAFESMGGVPTSTRRFLSRIIEHAHDYLDHDELEKELLARVASWIMIGNAQIRNSALHFALTN